MFRKTSAALSLCAALLCAAARAQDCAPPALVANAKSANIFTPEQEMVFGELAVQNMAGDIRFIRDERLAAYLERIGERLARHLPQTGIRFRFHLVDIPEANAYNLPGGHILVTRKLVAFAETEDDLAGVVAHELGHAVVRHAAADVSVALRKLLGVTSLGDRRDVAEKYNLLIERARTRNVSLSEGHGVAQEVEADRVALFAMAAAGYDPAAVVTFSERLFEAKAAPGGWFSVLFGSPPPLQKILREELRNLERLPAACRGRAAARPAAEFLKWQAEVVSYREAVRREELPGLVWKRELSPKLRSDVSHFAFSPDGRHLLAQDDYSVNVIARDPARVLFQIPVEGADEATFTPDGRFVVFATGGLRYEKWSVADAAPVEARELVLMDDCWEHKLSPDGNYLACVDTSADLNVLDVRTGKRVWEKKGFYELSWWEYVVWHLAKRRGAGDDAEGSFFRIEFSPDSRYVMFSRSDEFRARGGFVGDDSEDAALALDLTTLRPVGVGGELKKVSARAYVFLDASSVLGLPSGRVGDGGVFAFPSGKRLRKFDFGARVIKRTANPDYVIIKPLSDSKTGVFDLKRAAIVLGLEQEDATFWQGLLAYESKDGKVLLREAAYDEAGKTLDFKDVAAFDIPVSALRGLAAASVSDNLEWLLLSSKTRGGLWHLPTGERRLYLRGFRGGVAGNDGGALGDFPRQGDVPHGLVLLNGKTEATSMFRVLPERGARQYGRFVLVRASLNEKGRPSKVPLLDRLAGREGGEDYGLRREARFELRDVIKDGAIWSRDFPGQVPEYSFDEYSGRLIFYWRLGSDAGKEKLKESAALKARADALGNKADDYLVEVVDAFAQKTVGTMLLETGRGSFDVGRGLSEGDWLVLHDSEGRLLVYSIRTGELRHRFFGDTAAINPRRNQVVVENVPGEVSLYDLDTGDLKAGLRIGGSAAFVRFNLDGDRLFVLSDAQTAYAFDLDKLSAAPPPAKAAK